MVTSPLHMPIAGPKLRLRAHPTYRSLLAALGLGAALALGSFGGHIGFASHPATPAAPSTIINTSSWPLLALSQLSPASKLGSLGPIGLQQPSSR